MNKWISILTLSFLAGVSTASCEDELNEPESVSALFTATWGECSSTKAGDEDKVNTLDILVFDSNGCIIASGRNPSGGSVRLDVPKNRSTTCYALANAHGELSGIVTENQLFEMRSFLKDNTPGSLEMIGKITHTFNESDEVEINLERFAVKVVLEGLKLQLSNPVWTASGIGQIKITDIFLSNVVPECHYDFSPVSGLTAWYNKMAQTPCESDNLISKNMELTIHNEGSDESKHVLYAYPNPTPADREGEPWTERHTRLVVQALLGNEVCYYPITLPVLEANHCYRIQGLTITGAGSDNPDRYGNRTPILFTVNITPWTSDEKCIDFS